MKVGTLLLMLADLTTALKAKGYITPAGDVVGDFTDIAKDVELAATVEGILTTHGVMLPATADKIIKLLPLIVALVG